MMSLSDHPVVRALDELSFLNRCPHGDDIIVWNYQVSDEYPTETRIQVFKNPINNSLQISIRCYFGYIATKSISLKVLSRVTETLSHLQVSVSLKVVPMPYEEKWLFSVAYEANEEQTQYNSLPLIINQVEMAATELFRQMSEIREASFQPLNLVGFGVQPNNTGTD